MLLMLSGDIAINPGPTIDPTLTNPTPTENNALPFSGPDQSLNDLSLEIGEEHLPNTSLADEAQWFNKKGLHFVHLNCNSLEGKIDEIREFVLKCKPHVICFSETKIDDSVTDEKIKIDNYTFIRNDRVRRGGGVACYVKKGVNYNQRHDFSKDFKIFLLIFFYQ